MGSVWRICMWILGLKGLTVLTVINNFRSMTLRSELYLPGKKSVQEEPV